MKNRNIVSLIPASVVAVMGVLASIGLYWILDNYEYEKTAIQFKHDAQFQVKIVKQEIDKNLKVLSSIKSFFESTDNISRNSFHLFTKDYLLRHSNIQALEWIPRVPHSQRSQYVEQARKDGLRNFSFRERNASGKMEKAGDRAEYFPVYYVEPKVGNEKAIGFDLASNARRKEALNRARIGEQQVATAKITLVQEKAKQAGILIFEPIYERAREGRLKSAYERLSGYALSVLRVGDMINNATGAKTIFRKIIQDITDSTKTETLYDQDRWSSQTNDLVYSEAFKVAGRTWKISLAPKVGFYRHGVSPLTLGLFTMGCFLSIMISLYILQLQNTKLNIQQRVEQQTQHLMENEETLKKSLAEIETAKNRAEESSKLKSEFLANMSHEIRTPLNGILGMRQLLDRSILTEEQRSYTETIKNSGQSLLTIINDVLDISRIETGNLELDSAPFVLDDILEEIMSTMQGVAHEKQLDITLEIADNCRGSYMGDPKRLRQVLVNFIGNAVKFTETGGVNTIIKRQSDDQLYFEIKDTGPGIEQEQISRIFERFQQVDGTLQRKHGGTGLGLAISKELIQMMNGNCGVTSQIGLGSCFYFNIPLQRIHTEDVHFAAERLREKLPEREPETTSAPKNQVLSGPPRILLAEDNPTNRLIITEFLKSEDLMITEVDNGKDAVTTLKEQGPFDLILMDIQMPGMNGDVAMQQIRNDKTNYHQTPIIVLSANAMKGDKEKYIEGGANGYLSKPIDFDALLETIKPYISREDKTATVA